MKISKPKAPNFFTKKGKTLRSLLRFKNDALFGINSEQELITSLFAENITQLFDEKIPAKNRFQSLVQVKKALNIFKSAIDSFDVKRAWIISSFATFILFAITFLVIPHKSLPKTPQGYSIYAATPLDIGSSNYNVYAKDARAQKINEVFKYYNCPLEGLGEVFVYEADKNNIPWWIVAAISFQESSCGKMTPEPNSVESYNAWGWGVYGENVVMFDNWVRGIETVSKYLSNKFFSKGITEPCEIMKVYTPPSKGSWCKGVSHFGEEIVNFKSDHQ